MNALADGLFVLLWLVGLIGTFVPFLPATLIILGAALIHELLVGFSQIPQWLWITLLLLTALVWLVDNTAGLIGAKRYGASRAGVWGSFLGGVAGIFVLPPLGVFFMPFVGAFAGELISGKSLDTALRGAWGTVVGMLGGMAGKFLIHLVMGLLVLRAIF
ncbi:DUF456 domain-containing protein [Meiothermus granaticius]|uniref:DUF456 domain-containing protein n=2 Tax=Meiothermus granaticius TaxID=863370 RepID=UPI00118FEA5B|nr:DUF456 family protein [Meiothermus granaticius]GEM86142.1 hypothetical protein MGR01S_07670 [Meiothermus granaticius NBRC 107808]